MTDGAAAARKPLPLHDERAPIACTIGAGEIPDRIAVIERMRAAMSSLERTDTGLLLRFPREPGIEADVRRFAVDEKRCCQFWGFAVIDHGDALVLRWDGPRTADDLLDRLAVLLRSDDPVEGVPGLL